MPIILSRIGAVKMGEALRTGTVFLDGVGIALFKNNFIPTLDSLLAAFSESSFPGYAPQTINTPNPAFLSGTGRGEVDADLITFTATGASAEVAYGYFIYDLALDVIWCQRFNAPVPMGAPGASVDVGVKFTWFTEFTG